jgi:hypothetical protein
MFLLWNQGFGRDIGLSAWFLLCVETVCIICTYHVSYHEIYSCGDGLGTMVRYRILRVRMRWGQEVME